MPIYPDGPLGIRTLCARGVSVYPRRPPVAALERSGSPTQARYLRSVLGLYHIQSPRGCLAVYPAGETRWPDSREPVALSAIVSNRRLPIVM